MSEEGWDWNELSIGDLQFYLWLSGRGLVIEDGRATEEVEEGSFDYEGGW